MSNEHKNFEDRLKDRLLGEELPYEVSAWDKFQEMNNNNANSNIEDDDSKKDRNRKLGLWTWILLFVGFVAISVFAGQWGFNQVFDNKKLSDRTTNYEDNIDTQKSTETIINKTNSTQLENQNDSKTSDLENEDFAQPTDTTSGYGKSSNTYKSFLSKEQKGFISRSEDGNLSSNNKLNIESKNQNSQISQSSTNHDKPDVLEDVGVDQNSKAFNMQDSHVLPFINNDLNSLPSEVKDSQNGANSSTNIDKIIASNDLLADDRFISIANIGQTGIQDFILPVNFKFNKDVFVKPLKYKKNEFYIGIGYVNKFLEFSLKNAVGEGNQKYPTYLSLGYFRKVSPAWSLGLEGNLSHIRELPMSRELQDYHQTSTSFEYIVGTMKHSVTIYAGLSMMLKYQPLNSRLGVYGGLNMAYAISKQTSFQNDVEGKNTVIEELRVFHTGSRYYKDWDYGLAGGATFKIWKGFVLEGRAVLGLADVSDDYYWGEGRNTTTHYRLGLKYRFL